jgi:ATP-binding protein involved in chromosome partitioning
VVGVIENMAGLVHADGSTLELFGHGGGEQVAARLSEGEDQPVPLLTSVPLSIAMRSGGDSGLPIVLGDPADPASAAIDAAASALLARGRNLAGRSLGLDPRTDRR